MHTRDLHQWRLQLAREETLSLPGRPPFCANAFPVCREGKKEAARRQCGGPCGLLFSKCAERMSRQKTARKKNTHRGEC